MATMSRGVQPRQSTAETVKKCNDFIQPRQSTAKTVEKCNDFILNLKYRVIKAVEIELRIDITCLLESLAVVRHRLA